MLSSSSVLLDVLSESESDALLDRLSESRIDAAAREMQDTGTFEFARAGMPFARLQALFSTG